MTDKRIRDGRIPFHQQKKIGIDVTPGFVGRLVNDVGDKISALEKGGYRKIYRSNSIRSGEKDASDASQMGKIACQSVGNGVTGYYMEIPQKFYDQDQKSKQVENDKTMSDIGALKDMPEKVQRGEFNMEGSNTTIKIKH